MKKMCSGTNAYYRSTDCLEWDLFSSLALGSELDPLLAVMKQNKQEVFKLFSKCVTEKEKGVRQII